MKKMFFIFVLLGLMICFSHSEASASPYDFFGGFIPEGTPVIDGVLTTGEWDETGHLTLYKFFGEDAKIEIRMMWDQTYLYIAAEIEDFELWVDDYDPDTPWESTWDDDAFQWDIDPNFSRDAVMQPSDRTFAINANGTAYRFVHPDGQGGMPGVSQRFQEILRQVRFSGTLNDHTFDQISSETQKDKGFSLEVGISWQDLFGSASATAPDDGYSLGMNFRSIEDDTGGPLDPEYQPQWKRVFDELTGFMGEDGRPENWAEFVISATRDTTPPDAISSLEIGRITPFSAEIAFVATGDNGSRGYADAYEIRYASAAITEENWEEAKAYPNNFRPRKAGDQEQFRIIGLEPGTAYSIGVKAADERGNRSPPAVTSLVTSSASQGDKGFLTADPGGRYLSWENGEPFVVIGDNQGIPWPSIRTFYDGKMWDAVKGRHRNFFEEEGISEGREYLEYLSDHGVNTLRIMAESFDISVPVYLTEDVSGGPENIRFNSATLQFLRTFLDECADYGISVILVPFDTFYYKERWSVVPFSTSMGGPLSSPSDIFAPAFRDYLKAILAKLAETVGDRRNLLAWDILNEFDSDDPVHGWNRASFDEREEAVNDLARYLKATDPNHLVYLSSVRWNPIFTTHQDDVSNMMPGADPALVLNNPEFHLNSTHTYYPDIRDPNYNHPENSGSYLVADLNNTVSPAVKIRQGLQFYYANTLTPKPYINSEAGPLKYYTPEYDSYFTQADDCQFFHNMIWAHLASGDVGTGLRWPGDMLSDHALADQMRKYQLAMRHFLQENLDFSGFQPIQIGQYMEVVSTIPVVRIGITDGKQGILFLINDERKAENPPVFGAELRIPKLDPYGEFTFEFWDSYDATRISPTARIFTESDGSGEIRIALPTFSKTQVIKFHKTGRYEPEPPPIGDLVTHELWIRAVIKTEEKGDIEAVWQKGGEGKTAGGHEVIWGYFFASPEDVTWGSRENPDLFVKLWFDASGRIDVNFFHVSVPDIEVYSDYPFDGSTNQVHTATTERRYIRHYYYKDGRIGAEEKYENGQPPSGYWPAGMPSGDVTNQLRIAAIINTEEKGPADAVWRLGGESDTSGGHRVVWGYFHASPSDVKWGSQDNPDLFVKLWFDARGRIDVNFFHVSVPDIEVYSDYPITAGGYSQRGTTILDNRYIRHEYWK
ncbi:sugar-binding protein [Desulfobacterales bacterium HSG2]|nr:sugar-binding protein [Desulfobacterales bacterium HSG2]